MALHAWLYLRTGIFLEKKAIIVFEIKILLVSHSCLCRMKYFSEYRKHLLSHVFAESLNQLKSVIISCKPMMRGGEERNMST